MGKYSNTEIYNKIALYKLKELLSERLKIAKVYVGLFQDLTQSSF